MYLDPSGLIEQQDGDGGDKLQRESFWFLGQFYSGWPSIPGMTNYPEALEILTDANGNLQRDEVKYTAVADPNDVSRDQLIPTVIACGVYGYEDRVKRIFANVVKNFSRYPNNSDVAFLIDYSRFFRALRLWPLYPVIFLFDIWFLISTLFTVARSYFDPKNKWVGDDLNFIADLKQAQEIYQTPFSFLCRKIFKKFRKGGPMYGLKIYFDPKTGANTEFIDLWKPIVEDF